ncbi:MAG: GTPase RsgA [Gemmatimonadetes bacterium]|nr:GTPase RsgA [Gemmatimonadota bacterium]
MSRAGGTYRVYRDGEVLAASLRGRVKHGAEERVLVGDRVTLGLHRDGSVTIEGVEDRKSLLRRRSPGKRRGVRAVAANVDQVVVVGSVREPQWDPYLVDRFLAVSEANQLPVLLVINKSDLAVWPAGSAGPADLAAPYEAAGYEVVRTSARTGEELDTLHRRLGGRASVFTGPTARSGAGRHTTVTAEMHLFEPDGFVIDTPGLRDIGLWGLEPLDVVHAFPEIARLAPECRFDNCRHLGEPRCAVEAASARGAVVPSRLWSYRQLLREALEAARPWS